MWREGGRGFPLLSTLSLRTSTVSSRTNQEGRASGPNVSSAEKRLSEEVDLYLEEQKTSLETRPSGVDYAEKGTSQSQWRLNQLGKLLWAGTSRSS